MLITTLPCHSTSDHLHITRWSGGVRRSETILPLLLLALVFFWWTTTSEAGTLHVPKQFSTIQEAIDNAVNGDTVDVAGGIYRGPGNKALSFKGKTITVHAPAGPLNTVIDCEGSGRGIIFFNGETSDAVFSGFTITNGYVDGNSFYGGKGGGIHIYNSSPTVADCIIRHSHAAGFGGGGIWLNRSSATLKNCLVEHNSTEISGGGIAMIDCLSPTITNSIIRFNQTTGYSSGGGVGVIRSHPLLTNLTISHNDSNTHFPYEIGKVTNSGGISFREGSTGRLENSIISHNKAQERGGVGGWDAAPTIHNCLIANNEATVDGGGGVGFYNNSEATLSKSTIRDNTAREYGGGISVWNESASTTGPTFIDCLIENNSASDSGGGMNVLDSSISLNRSIIRGNTSVKRAGVALKANGTTSSTLINNLIYNNIASEFGGGVTCFSGANATITNNTIVNNRSGSGSAWGYNYSGGIYNFQSNVSIANSILWGNTPSDSLLANATVTYSIVDGGYPGIGNIDANPQFIATTDFHLSSVSPGINSASADALFAPTDDLGAHKRDQGDRDMGAYEHPYTTGGPGAKGELGASIDWLNCPSPLPPASSVNPILFLLFRD